MKNAVSGFRRTRTSLLLLPVLLALVAMGLQIPAAEAQSSSGSSFNNFSSEPRDGGVERDENLEENEYRDAQGNIYRVNPQVQLAENTVVDVLFPAGEADIGQVLNVTATFIENNDIEEGTVLSILPSAVFPEGALVKVTSLEPTGAGHTLVASRANLDDIIMETSGEVSFQGVPFDEGDSFIYNNSASGTVTIPYKLELDEVLERVNTNKKGDADNKTEETTSDPTAELSGDIKFGTELGFDRPNIFQKGDVSFDADASVTGSLSLQSEDTYQVSAGAFNVLKKKLESLKKEKRFAFFVGPILVVGTVTAQPTGDIMGELGVVPKYSPKFEANIKAGLKYIGEENTIEPTAEHSLTFDNFQLKNPFVGDREFAFKLEAAPGVEVEAEFYELMGVGTGAQFPTGVEIGSDKCEAYVKLEGPMGYVFVQPFVESQRVEARFTPKFDLLKGDLGCTWIEEEDPNPAPEYDTRPVSAAIKAGILNMAMPAVCRQPAGRLENGSLPDPVLNGFLTVLTDTSADALEDQVQAVWIDADKDGNDEIALLVQCYAGGVGWPQSIFLLDSDLNLISAGPENTGLQLPSGYENARSTFSTFEVKGNALVLEYPTYEPGEPACCGSLIATGTMEIRDDHLVPVGQIVTRPRA